MSELRAIHELLKAEYAISRFIWWVDESSGKPVNDVTAALNLIVQTAKRLRAGDQAAWQVLVAYCLNRSMSYILMVAIGEYLHEDVQLEPLPLIDLKAEAVPPHERGGEIHLFEDDDAEFVHMRGHVERPEPDRVIACKHDHCWTRYKWRLADDRPPMPYQKVSHSIHWMFV